MAPLPRAAIELCGSSMRYAEAEPAPGGARLLRLGACEFAFDVRGALERGHETDLATLADAVRDVFRGSRADGLAAVLHPDGLTSWAAPFDAAADDAAVRARLEQEAALFAGSGPHALLAHPLFREPDGAGGTRAWVLALALPELWAARLDRATRGLDRPGARVLLSTQGAATALAALLRSEPGDGFGNASEPARPGDGFAEDGASEDAALAVGLYDAHAEFALVAGGRTRLTGHARTAEPADAAFAALRLVAGTAGAHAPRAVRLYGTHATPGAFEAFGAAFGVEARALDPLDAVALDTPRPPGFTGEAFAPALGATLGRFEG